MSCGGDCLWRMAVVHLQKSTSNFWRKRRSLQEGPAHARSSRTVWGSWVCAPALLRFARCENFSDGNDPSEPARLLHRKQIFLIVSKKSKQILPVSKFCKQFFSVSKFDFRKQFFFAVRKFYLRLWKLVCFYVEKTVPVSKFNLPVSKFCKQISA